MAALIVFFSFLGEGKIYLQQDAKTSVCLPTVGSAGSTGGTIRCTNTSNLLLHRVVGVIS